MNIIDLIPYGHENGTTTKELATLLHTSSREVRNQVHEARADHVICNLQDGMGFFRPTKDEDMLVKAWLKQEQSRSDKIMKATSYARYLYS